MSFLWKGNYPTGHSVLIPTPATRYLAFFLLIFLPRSIHRNHSDFVAWLRTSVFEARFKRRITFFYCAPPLFPSQDTSERLTCVPRWISWMTKRRPRRDKTEKSARIWSAKETIPWGRVRLFDVELEGKWRAWIFVALTGCVWLMENLGGRCIYI